MSNVNPAQVRYFSEGGEDYLLWSLFDYKADGSFMDVGAFDGRYLSNSLSFAQIGWRGVCVEPTAEYLDMCAKNQPHSICVRAACIGDSKLESVTFNAEPLGVYSRIEVAAGAQERLEESYQKYGAEPQKFEKVEVPATTVSTLIDEYLDGRAPDFLSIDVEGGEVDVLTGMDFSRHRPRVIIAEANDESKRNELVQALESQNYALIRNVGNNYFFTDDPELVVRGQKINIACVIERHYHPKGIQYTFRGIALGKIIDEEGHRELLKLRRKAEQSDLALRRARKLERRHDVILRALESDRSRLQQADYDLDITVRTKINLEKRVEELTQALAIERASVKKQANNLDALKSALATANQKLQESQQIIDRHLLIPWPFRRS